VWNPYWLVSWNSNNHSCSDKAEWIMSWGVAGGPSLWTWSSPRREGDLSWERSGDNYCRVWEPLQVQATKSSIVTYTIWISSLEIILLNYVLWMMFMLWIVLFSLISVSLPFCLCLLVLMCSPLQWSPMVDVSRAESRWWCPPFEQELILTQCCYSFGPDFVEF